LRLAAAEWAAIAPPGLPPDLRPTAEPAAGTLAERGIVDAAGDPVPPVAVNLALLASRRWLRIEIGAGPLGLRALFALGDPLAASLVTLAGGAVELSLFEAAHLGAELLRAVPPAEQLATGASRVRRALSAAPPPALPGRRPLAGLSDVDIPSALGVLRCLVTGPAAGGLVVGQVVWLATEAGWVGLAPEPAFAPEPASAPKPASAPEPASGPERWVRLVPVRRADFGAWIAPYVAQLLAAGDG
jgi:hypothetical protein